MSTLFEFEDASISIGGKEILSAINWNIVRGGHTWVTGRNGSGKTILCKALCGRLTISKGRARPMGISYDDIALVSFTDRSSLFHSVNNHHYYQQRFNAWDADGHLTVRDYLYAKGVKTKDFEDDSFVKEIGLSDLLDLERIKLSSGQIRKMLLASALLKKPHLLILDSAYIGLDADSRDYLNRYLDRLVNETGITLILSGHVTTLPNCIQKYVHINEGHLKLCDQRPISNYSGSTNNCKQTIIQSLRNYNSKNSTPIASSEIVHFENVPISYKNYKVFDIAEWTVQKGDKWCVFGNNGSGKSTLVSMIYADHPQAYSKAIRLFGHPLGKGRSIWEVKKLIGFSSPELHAFFRTQYTALEVILTGLYDKFEIMGTVPEHKLEFALQLLGYFEMEDYQKTPYHQLAAGHQRLCLLIRALLKCPVLFLLDEPFQGLDFLNLQLAKELLEQLINPEQSLIFIAHFKNEIPLSINKVFNL